MIKFVSNTRNPYASIVKEEENVKEKFIPKSKANTSYMFRNCTSNITGRKVTFMHVQ